MDRRMDECRQGTNEEGDDGGMLHYHPSTMINAIQEEAN